MTCLGLSIHLSLILSTSCSCESLHSLPFTAEEISLITAMGVAFVDEYKHKYLEDSLCYASLAKQQYSLLTLCSLRLPSMSF